MAVGHQSTSQPIGADRRLAGTHTGPRATANVFERADGGILEPGRNVLRPDKLALAHQRLKRELVAVRLGNADLRRPVAQLVQLVVAIVERDDRGRAGRRYAKPARDQVGDPLRHQPVGRHLAAHDAGKPGNPVALLVVDHGKVAAHFAALGLGAQVVERPHAGIGAHRPRGADAVRHQRSFLDHVSHLFPFDGQHLRVGHPDGRGAEDGDAQRGNDDVAVARLVTAIDRGMCHPMRQHDHHAFDGNDFDFDVEELGHESCPRAGRVDHRFAADRGLFSGHGVPCQHAGYPITIAIEAGDLGIGAHLRSSATRGFNVAHHQVEGVQVAVFGNPEDGADLLGESRLATARLFDRNPLAADARFATALHEARNPRFVLLRNRDEVAAGVLDRGPGNSTENAAFLDALDGGGQVVDAIASARVQQAMRPAGGARSQVALFDQHRINAAHGQVTEHPGAR